MKTNRVNENQITKTEDYCYLYQGKPFTGIGLDYISGRLIRETKYFDGMKHGVEKIWDYEQGALVKEVCYRKNSTHGILQCWYINGQRKSLEYIEFSIRTKGVIWNQFGEIVDIFVLEEDDSLFQNLVLSKATYYLEPQETKDTYKLNEAELKRLNELEKELDELILDNK
jgi:hypothetical protein